MGDHNIVAAFSEEQVVKLTSISQSQLRYWDQTDFYHPAYPESNRRLSFSRIYSFLDIAALRVLNVLRNQYGVPLQHLRGISGRLSQLAEQMWTGVRLYVFEKRVYWIDPDTNLPQQIASGQYLLPTVELQVVISDTRRDVANFNAREASKIGKIERSRFINHNAPVIAGTRITVGAIKRFSKAGYSTAQILKEYPDLKKEDIEAALLAA